MRLSRSIFLSFLAAAVFAVALAAVPAPARAQDPLCDVALYDQMAQRARLQGQRETVTVENLIYKPDSVMEYTCFTRFVEHIPNNLRYASAAFFEPIEPDGENHHPRYEVSFDFPAEPLMTVARAPAEQWMFGNFGHNYLGGRVTDTPATATPGTNYTCDAMSVIWELAKCQQFAPEDPEDGFYGLQAFTTIDEIRRLPTACTAAFTADIGTIPALPADPVTTNALAVVTECGEPIPTGQVINIPRAEGEPASRPAIYEEHICPNPTCTYTPTGMSDGTCAP